MPCKSARTKPATRTPCPCLQWRAPLARPLARSGCWPLHPARQPRHRPQQPALSTRLPAVPAWSGGSALRPKSLGRLKGPAWAPTLALTAPTKGCSQQLRRLCRSRAGHLPLPGGPGLASLHRYVDMTSSPGTLCKARRCQRFPPCVYIQPTPLQIMFQRLFSC